MSDSVVIFPVIRDLFQMDDLIFLLFWQRVSVIVVVKHFTRTYKLKENFLNLHLVEIIPVCLDISGQNITIELIGGYDFSVE